jgi:hypothetical protein
VWGPSQSNAFEQLKDKLCSTPVLAYPNFERPSIFTTDASKLAVAAILSQEQDGLERPIAYASRQLNKAEQAYSASEAEMLALLCATKSFRCYLYGADFVARTDHAALRYLKNFADGNARLMRWSLRLSELKFSVEHRPGTIKQHVDALSRHIGFVIKTGNLDPDRLIKEQAEDAFCMKLNPGKYSSRSEFF